MHKNILLSPMSKTTDDLKHINISIATHTTQLIQFYRWMTPNGKRKREKRAERAKRCDKRIAMKVVTNDKHREKHNKYKIDKKTVKRITAKKHTTNADWVRVWVCVSYGRLIRASNIIYIFIKSLIASK